MKPLYKIWTAYILIIIFMIIAGTSFGQVVVTHFNASWNNHNKADWVDSLTDCEITYVDISKSPKIQKRYKITVVPTVLIFKDGEEIYRFESDVSFKLIATRKELQEYINELIKDRY